MEFEQVEGGADNELIQFGQLKRAGDMAGGTEEAAALRTSTPVFVMSIDEEKFLRHVDGTAAIEIAAIESNACVIITMKVQFGGALYTWLADPTDSEVWRAMDNMDKTGQLAFAFEGDADTWLQGFAVRHKRGIDRYRREAGRKGVPFLAEAMGRIASGAIYDDLDSIIADQQVTYSPVNILATRGVVRDAEKLYADFSTLKMSRGLGGGSFK
jgi:hypothetical protein